MPSKSGPVRPKRPAKRAGMSLEEVRKIEKIRSSAPLQIMDGLKARRGRPKRHWPNPVTRLNPYEDVPMVVNPQTTAETQQEPHQPKTKTSFPPLKIVIEPIPSARKFKRDVTFSSFEQNPKRAKLEHDEEVPSLSNSTKLGHNFSLGLPQHVHASHGHGQGYSFEDFHMSTRQVSKSPSESHSSLSTPPGSYPTTPLTAPYTAAPGLMSPQYYGHSSPGVSSISLPPLASSAPSAWQTLPTLGPTSIQHDYARAVESSWSWSPQSFYPNTYNSTNGYPPY
ncbi:hypothetical protein TWF730_001339 [Orbilia blumenaviensis]|uniref:Uncharacterized protein n=1 Tax=Orbilia blumenaviensis TaxID=1796055 RepID=A0AAV9UID8_9PEZI